MEDLKQIGDIINAGLVDSIVKIDDNAKRIRLMLIARIINIGVILENESEIAENIINLIHEYCKIVKQNCNFFGVCIQRIFNMSNENLLALIKDMTIDMLTRLFIGSGGSETKLFVELKSDKKIINNECRYCGHTEAELIESSFGTHKSCLVCFCVTSL